MAAGADNTATFAIDFNATGASRGAGAATDALKKLGEQIDDDSAALAGMQKALRNLQGGTSVNIKAFQDLKKQIEAKKATLAQTQEKFLQLGGTFRKTKKPTDEQADALKGLFAQMQRGGGPIGGLAGKLEGLRGLMAGGGALVVGAVAFTAALVAVAAAALYAGAALLKYGVAAADAYRSERLQLEGLTKIRNWYGIAAGSAAGLQTAIDGVSAGSALGREEINGMAQSLYRLNFRGAALEQALEGVATATSAAGQGQGEFYKQLYTGAARSGVAIKRISDDIKARFGGVAKAQMLSLTVQSKKLKESFDGLFRGLNIEKFLEAMKSITDLFSQNTASGRALKQLLEIVFQPMIDGLATLGPIAKRFFQGMVLAAQGLVIEYYNVRLALKGAFGNTDIFKNLDAQKIALQGGKAALYALAAGAFVAAAGIALMGLAMLAVASPFIVAGYAAYRLSGAVLSVYGQLRAIDWGALGSSLIDGFVGGITRGVGKVISAVKDMASAAKNALKHALDSHSPSKVGIAIGATLPQGGAIGIQKDTPLVAKAARRMAIVATNEAEPEPRRGFSFPKYGDGGEGGGSSAAASAGGSSAPATSLTVHMPIVVHATIDKPQDIAEQVREALHGELKTFALSIGAANV